MSCTLSPVAARDSLPPTPKTEKGVTLPMILDSMSALSISPSSSMTSNYFSASPSSISSSSPETPLDFVMEPTGEESHAHMQSAAQAPKNDISSWMKNIVSASSLSSKSALTPISTQDLLDERARLYVNLVRYEADACQYLSQFATLHEALTQGVVPNTRTHRKKLCHLRARITIFGTKERQTKRRIADLDTELHFRERWNWRHHYVRQHIMVDGLFVPLKPRCADNTAACQGTLERNSHILIQNEDTF